MLNGFMSLQVRREHRTPSETILGMSDPRLNSYLQIWFTGTLLSEALSFLGLARVHRRVQPRNMGFLHLCLHTARVLFSTSHRHLGDVVAHNTFFGRGVACDRAATN